MRMFEYQSSEGQSAISIVMVIMALILWAEFYRIRTPQEKVARITAWLGVVFNTFVLATVLYFRYKV